MKFRDQNTGEVFQNITGAFVNFCAGRNCKSKLSGYVCPFREKSISTPGCSTWAINHPTEAARLMGYEVIEDETEKTFTEKELLAVLDKLADSCDTSNADESVTGYKLFDYHWKCGNANAVNFIKSALGIESAKKTVEEANMEKKDKPRLAEVLGVEEDEKWRYPGCFGMYRVHNGVREYWDENNGWLACDCEEDLIKIINHPESIIRLPRLTEEELAICKAVGAKWVSRGALGTKTVVLWDAKPECFDDGTFGSTDTAHKLARMYTGFDSVHLGNCICVEEAGEK